MSGDGVPQISRLLDPAKVVTLLHLGRVAVSTFLPAPSRPF